MVPLHVRHHKNQTGALRLPPPPKLAKKFSTAGSLNKSPTTGVSCKLWAAMGKNWPNKYTNPYSWQIIPITGHLIITRKIPPKKDTIPRIRSRLLKKRNVLENPFFQESRHPHYVSLVAFIRVLVFIHWSEVIVTYQLSWLTLSKTIYLRGLALPSQKERWHRGIETDTPASNVGQYGSGMLDGTVRNSINKEKQKWQKMPWDDTWLFHD